MTDPWPKRFFNTSKLLVFSMLLGLLVRMLLTALPGYLSDQFKWAIYAREITRDGVTHVYSLTLRNPDLGIYPPGYHYLLGVVGTIYQQFFSSSFLIYSKPLNMLLKLVPILGDCLIGLAIYRGVRQLADKTMALRATMGYMFNPAIIFASAYWGMFGDSIYTLFVLLALFALYFNTATLASIAIAIAITIKPQAVVFLPLILVVGLRSTPPKLWIRPILAGAITLGLIWLPFIVAGTFGEAIAALRQSVGLFPVLSAQAHNFWYLITFGNSWVSDTQPALGPFNPRTLSLLVFGLLYLLVLAKLNITAGNRQLFPVAAYIGFAFFMISTEMHESYTFAPVCLLSMCFWVSRPLRYCAYAITLTATLNMLFHDRVFTMPAIEILRVLNSAANLTIFAIWTWLVWHRRVEHAPVLAESGSEEAATRPI